MFTCVCKFQIQKHFLSLVKQFAFLKNVCYQYLKFVLQVTYCFLTSCWLAHNQLSWNVSLFSCNPIVQLCLCGPSYSGHTVSLKPQRLPYDFRKVAPFQAKLETCRFLHAGFNCTFENQTGSILIQSGSIVNSDWVNLTFASPKSNI